LTYGYYSRDKKHGEPGKQLDWAWVEATEILPDGSIVPGASVGATPEILAAAEKIIVEVNTGLPSMKGLHDIVISQDPYAPFLPSSRSLGPLSSPFRTLPRSRR
jgi:acetyl-CoA hydrolase